MFSSASYNSIARYSPFILLYLGRRECLRKRPDFANVTGFTRIRATMNEDSAFDRLPAGDAVWCRHEVDRVPNRNGLTSRLRSPVRRQIDRLSSRIPAKRLDSREGNLRSIIEP